MESKILDLLKQGFTFENIQSQLHLSNHEMFKFLENINEDIFKHYNHIKYYENGKKRFSSSELKEMGIITQKDSDYYKAVLISDTHFGSIDENIDLLNRVYDFCIQNNINNIFHGGDLVDGINGYCAIKIQNPIEQINHVINDYPKDSSIMSFILLGNHDLGIISEENPLHTEIINNRKDMVCLGYGTKEIYIKNDNFILKHSILIDKSDNNLNGKLIFKGHSHHMKLFDDLNNYHVYIPSLSNLQFVEGTIPGFLQLEFGFVNGYIIECLITHYGILGNQIINMNSIKMNLKSHKKDNYIKREETLIKVKH